MKNIFKGLFLFVPCLIFAAVNINTATKEELMLLGGIGEAKANAIIEYRKTNKFNKIEDIKNIKGIGDKRFDAIKDDLTVSGETDTTNLKSNKKSKTKKSTKQKKANKPVAKNSKVQADSNSTK